MAGYSGSGALIQRQQLETPSSQKSQVAQEELFYKNCRAAYLAVFRSSLENITSKEQLCLVLQQAGRNPSQKRLSRYWTPRTSKLSFDDFCEILKKEKPTEKTELIKAFQKIDLNGDGYITHNELYKVLTKKGEKMTPEEVKDVIALADTNQDGKLDYHEFCKLFTSTADQCQKAALEKLEADTRMRRQQFGSESESAPKNALTQAVIPSAGTPQKTDLETTPRKADSRPSSRPSSARSRRASVSSTITMGASNIKSVKLAEPKSIQDWHHTSLKGCFFLEEDGGIMSLQYRLHILQTSTVYLTIKPLNLSQAEDKTSSWMSVDTALYILRENERPEDSDLVCFTELRDKEKFGWKGELSSGVYYLIPFTTGCRLKRKRKIINKQAQLVFRGDNGELVLTKEFRSALSDIFEVIDLDGNGLLSLEEYNFFEQRTSGEKCDEEAWAVCKENFDTKKNELTRQGFMELNLMEANDREGDPRDLWVTLESMGYNRALEMVEACPFVVDVYCEVCKPKMKAVSLESGSKALSTAVYKSVINKGEAKVMKGNDNVIIYTYKSDARITAVIANKSNNKVTVHVNNEQSKNCVSSRGIAVFAVEVPPRTNMVCQHVMPVNERQEWTYNCVESLMP
ncbi:EF-hand calcium-binding domain-containing protein 7 [Acipenser ruthenus]|uniref:EF-hand calcium-binding domain-containing protein 7 n=1 Tax=Acipenser ruthenus TaxID=7906 RepID=UPI002740DEB3|nr:EF-hand calcium-binding domain-containing protein 7 [Acipenser ruthenus]XP_058887485.1 EF-hand calcium-binding domain-containing protein 7 [Acipenser ruthenus]XP_058887486.1 EF-hand calcium-binding domain-containing protein 7 [Acipenser ruthenus]XP_058887487.1 EF-hand calcium-binding domain-containing protein 7 [Acipenser ruthenus]